MASVRAPSTSRPSGTRAVPDVVSAAVGLSITDEASAVLVEEDGALDALETRGVPLEVRCHAEDVLVSDLTTATYAKAQAASTHHPATLFSCLPVNSIGLLSVLTARLNVQLVAKLIMILMME